MSIWYDILWGKPDRKTVVVVLELCSKDMQGGVVIQIGKKSNELLSYSEVNKNLVWCNIITKKDKNKTINKNLNLVI